MEVCTEWNEIKSEVNEEHKCEEKNDREEWKSEADERTYKILQRMEKQQLRDFAEIYIKIFHWRPGSSERRAEQSSNQKNLYLKN